MAVGFLALDGALLFLAGMWSRRPGLMLWGVGFGIGAIAVVFYWRRHLRQLRTLRAGLEARLRELQELESDFRGE